MHSDYSRVSRSLLLRRLVEVSWQAPRLVAAAAARQWGSDRLALLDPEVDNRPEVVRPADQVASHLQAVHLAQADRAVYRPARSGS